MTGYDKPLTPERIAAVKDEDIDFGDVPEPDETFRREVELVERGPVDRTTIRGRAKSEAK